MTVTIIANEPPYDTERTWNALRLADALLAKDVSVNVFLMGGAVVAAKKGQRVPTGYYNLEQMTGSLIEKGARFKLCGTCCKSRGLVQDELVEGTEISGMLYLAEWTKESDKVISF